ncbi:hypothetical protein ST9NA_030 [Salmonella phage 9NA]|uniref:Uncharacterized protein n=1 Tax=Salmonella phage 9NA TaxID=1113547 RepID=A0A060D1J9_9CAUD|nr:hypothetical protein ST9NA_030 [Salmonella phage 9NA]AIB07033.1 hypothetical protein 9NA_030 [Salmonella phage 9NA]EGC6279315.1 hypothetical protein [Salmonella enterica]
MISELQAFHLMVKHSMIIIHCDRDKLVFTDDLQYTEQWSDKFDKPKATCRLIERVARDRGEQL